jgi:hypothetical protein
LIFFCSDHLEIGFSQVVQHQQVDCEKQHDLQVVARRKGRVEQGERGFLRFFEVFDLLISLCQIPPKCFVKQLLILGNNSKPLATLRAEASAMSPSSPKVGRHTSGSVTSSPALSRHASPAPKSDPAEAAVVSVSRPVEVEASEPASISAPAVTVNSESPSSSSSDALLSLRNTSANSPSVLRKLRPSGSFTNSSDGEGSPDSTKTERRRSVLGSLRKGDAPSVVISAIEANDPATTVLNLEKNVR